MELLGLLGDVLLLELLGLVGDVLLVGLLGVLVLFELELLLLLFVQLVWQIGNKSKKALTGAY